MKFKEIEFKSRNAEKIYRDYIVRVKRYIRILNQDNQTEVLLEINSHIYESFTQNSDEAQETEKLLDSLDKLGEPDVFLKALVAEKKLDEATRTFNPVKIVNALVLNIGNGISYIIFGLLYLLLFAFIYVIIAKLASPENIGLYYRPGKVFVIGKYTAAGINEAEFEQLGNWFIPVMITAILFFYTVITILLKLKTNLKNKS